MHHKFKLIIECVIRYQQMIRSYKTKTQIRDRLHKIYFSFNYEIFVLIIGMNTHMKKTDTHYLVYLHGFPLICMGSRISFTHFQQ